MSAPVASVLPAVALLPMVAAVPIALSGRWPNLREAWSAAAAAGVMGTTLAMAPAVHDGFSPEAILFTLVPGASFVLRADPLGLVFAALCAGLWLLTTAYSVGYVRALEEHAQTRYFCCFAVCVGAATGVALAGNLITFLLFYELLTLATYPLVVHKETPDAIRVGRIYLAYTLGAGACLLGGLAGVHVVAGTTTFRPGGIVAAGTSTAVVWGLFSLLLIGVGVKAAIMPLHAWLPLAMIAPTPVSALLHAVAVVNAGVFGVIRVTGFVIGPERLVESGAATFLAVLASATILLASLVALTQDNLKRLLAFSTVSQLSYIVLGTALFTRESLTGAVQHMVNHGTLKITLFFCAGAIYVATGRERVSELAGLGRRLPVTMGVFAVAALSLAGIPPAAGFLSKWYLIEGALQAHAWLATGVLLGSSLLNLAYFVPIISTAFFKPLAGGDAVSEPSPLIIVPLILSCLLGVTLGVAPNVLVGTLDLARIVARTVLGAP